MELSEKIKALRKESGQSQQELAEKLNISRQSISRWENGTNQPDLDMLVKIADEFSVSIEELLNGNLEMEVRQSVEQTRTLKRYLKIIIPVTIVSLVVAVFFVVSYIQTQNAENYPREYERLSQAFDLLVEENNRQLRSTTYNLPKDIVTLAELEEIEAAVEACQDNTQALNEPQNHELSKETLLKRQTNLLNKIAKQKESLKLYHQLRVYFESDFLWDSEDYGGAEIVKDIDEENFPKIKDTVANMENHDLKLIYEKAVEDIERQIDVRDYIDTELKKLAISDPNSEYAIETYPAIEESIQGIGNRDLQVEYLEKLYAIPKGDLVEEEESQEGFIF